MTREDVKTHLERAKLSIALAERAYNNVQFESAYRHVCEAELDLHRVNQDLFGRVRTERVPEPVGGRR
jgi:hypothetical protein